MKAIQSYYFNVFFSNQQCPFCKIEAENECALLSSYSTIIPRTNQNMLFCAAEFDISMFSKEVFSLLFYPEVISTNTEFLSLSRVFIEAKNLHSFENRKCLMDSCFKLGRVLRTGIHFEQQDKQTDQSNGFKILSCEPFDQVC